MINGLELELVVPEAGRRCTCTLEAINVKPAGGNPVIRFQLTTELNDDVLRMLGQNSGRDVEVVIVPLQPPLPFDGEGGDFPGSGGEGEGDS